MQSGFIKLWRKFTETSFYKNPNAAHLAVHLLLDCNHEPRKFVFNGKEQICDRGQTVTGLLKLKQQTGISIQSLRTALCLLSATGFLTSKATNRFRVISICKYNEYQDKPTSQLTIYQQTTNKQLTTNNIRKNVKNDKNTTTPEAANAADDGLKPVNWDNCKTDLQRLISHYVHVEMPELYQKATQSQATGVFKRYGKAASEILSVAGDIDTAKRAFDTGRKTFNERGLSWNLSTISKNIAEFVNSSIGGNHGNR